MSTEKKNSNSNGSSSEEDELMRLKYEIINKLKSGKRINTCDKEGFDIFEYVNETYQFSSFDDLARLTYVKTYKTDEMALDYLIGTKSIHDQLQACKNVLNKL